MLCIRAVADETAWTVDPAGAAAGVTLAAFVKARAGVFRACYQKELNRTPDIAGKLVVKFSIPPDGTVSRVLIDAGKTTLASVPVVECIKQNILRLKFPAKGTGSEVVYPFVFSAGK